MRCFKQEVFLKNEELQSSPGAAMRMKGEARRGLISSVAQSITTMIAGGFTGKFCVDIVGFEEVPEKGGIKMRLNFKIYNIKNLISLVEKVGDKDYAEEGIKVASEYRRVFGQEPKSSSTAPEVPVTGIYHQRIEAQNSRKAFLALNHIDISDSDLMRVCSFYFGLPKDTIKVSVLDVGTFNVSNVFPEPRIANFPSRSLLSEWEILSYFGRYNFVEEKWDEFSGSRPLAFALTNNRAPLKEALAVAYKIESELIVYANEYVSLIPLEERLKKLKYTPQLGILEMEGKLIWR